MCGICGSFHNQSVTQDDTRVLRAMMQSIHHRGPDEDGIETDDHFQFGHKRLSIIDLKHGQQPMSSSNRRYTIAFNGEIYNYLELRQKLEDKGIQFHTNSDTEVLLQHLIAHDTRGLNDLNGMFAFAFIDRQTRQWLMARDPFGVKPLYFTTLKDQLIFASEIKALLEHPDVQVNRNSEAIQEYLTFQLCLNGKTLFQNINALQPGHYIGGIKGKITKHKKYKNFQYEVDEYHNENYFDDQLSYLVKDSIGLQTRSDVPLGGYLSGGIDSSLVSTLAARHLKRPIPTFHGKFAEHPRYDESEYAREVNNDIQGEFNEIIPTAEDFIDVLPKLIYHMDEPVAGPGLFPQYMVSKLASKKVKVILGGQGGDEIFAGYARYLVGYLEQAIKGAIFRTQEEGSHIVTLSSIIDNLPVLQQYKPLMSNFWKDGLFDEMDSRYFRLIDRSPDVQSLLSDDMKTDFNKERLFQTFRSVFNRPDTKSYINKMTHFDMATLLPALLQVEDRVSMSVSLESRVPFLDTRIMDLVTTMPPAVKFQGGQTKHILKKACIGILPDNVLNRQDKMGFPVPLVEWMQKGCCVRDFVADTLLSEKSKQRGIYSKAGLESLIDSEKPFGRQLWGALCMELWHNIFID